MNNQDLRIKADSLRWYHTIDLGQGVVTRGVDNSPERLARVHLPGDLSGRSVLDIGAWDGFFQLKRSAGTRHAWSRQTITRGTGRGGGPDKARRGSSSHEPRSIHGSRISTWT